MKEEEVDCEGRRPSFTERIIRFLKSRVLVSRIPIIWTPERGSPEKGTDWVFNILSRILAYVSVVKATSLLPAIASSLFIDNTTL